MKKSQLSIFQATTKRGFDILMSFFGIILTSFLIIPAWIIASIETRSSGFFIQPRVGKHGKIFKVIKIRTMNKVAGIDTNITGLHDIRITKSGAFFRKTKIDELPQLWNVLLGQMSFVGPRPDVPGYADSLQGEAKNLLNLRPGITGPASLYFRHEEKILSEVDNPQKFNNDVIWPRKVFLNVEYLQNYSFKDDIKYILQTIFGGGEQCQNAQEVKKLSH